jgi:hypothetical protein
MLIFKDKKRRYKISPFKVFCFYYNYSAESLNNPNPVFIAVNSSVETSDLLSLGL